MTARLLVVTDLDGSLLDAHDYSWQPAREALAALNAAGAGLVLASSKTRAEMQALAGQLEALVPVTALIVENGGALVFPASAPAPGGPGPHDGRPRPSGGASLELGVPRARLLTALDAIAGETSARVRGFSALSAEELSALCGLPPAAAALALRREYDEPFVLEDDTPQAEAALLAAAAARGLTLTRGGRFLHLAGPSDKGRALRVLMARERAAGRPAATLALGDAPNDLPLLRAADRAVVVPRPGGRPDAVLAEGLPGAECAPHPGPRGWNAAVLAVLQGARLARVREALDQTPAR